MGGDPTFINAAVNGEVAPIPAVPGIAMEPRGSLRVFGCLPNAGARGCTEAGVRKASREETAGRG
jgi:hypothetical protein